MRTHAQPTLAADTHTRDTSVQSSDYIASTNPEADRTALLVRAADNIATIEPTDEVEFHFAALYGFCANSDNKVFNFQPGQFMIRFHAETPATHSSGESSPHLHVRAAPLTPDSILPVYRTFSTTTAVP